MSEHIDAGVADGEARPSRWVHYGMTSSDLGDTALCCQMVQAIDILLGDVRRIDEVCKRRAFAERDTLCVGRTHGIHAEPMTMGMKFARWAWAAKRAEERLMRNRDNIAIGAISGAVGSYSNIDPFVEEYVCEKLGLTPEPLSTQVIPRDRHAQYLAVLATVAATAEEIATEIRALQKSDTLEAEEPFAVGQKGSSAMPHKRNPIIAERVCGLARVIKANAQVGFDNVALWHERMMANLESTRGLIYSSRVLLALVDTGMTREDAYEIVQTAAMKVWEDIRQAVPGPGLRDTLESSIHDFPLDFETMERCFDPRGFLTRTSVLFGRLERCEFS